MLKYLWLNFKIGEIRKLVRKERKNEKKVVIQFCKQNEPKIRERKKKKKIRFLSKT